MLTFDQFDSLSDPILSLYEEFSLTVIRDIARRIVKTGEITVTAAWQTQRLIEAGGVYNDVLTELAILSGKSKKVIARQMADAGVKSLSFDDKIYEKAGLKPIPLKQSPAMTRFLLAGIEKTNGHITNLTLTTASAAQTQFIHALDIAYMQVATGTFDYNTAIRNAIKSVGSSGLEVFYPSGHVDKLDVAVRRAVLTGTAQTTHALQWMRADQMGVELVQVSAHIGARPSHAEWQGGIYSRYGDKGEYRDFTEATGYGTGEGLGGYNCRHSWYPYFPGISKELYDRVEREDISSREVTYNGKQLSVYEASQYQRSIERKIREWKRQAEALKAAEKAYQFEQSKVSYWQARMRAFIKQTGLGREYVRERV